MFDVTDAVWVWGFRAIVTAFSVIYALIEKTTSFDPKRTHLTGQH